MEKRQPWMKWYPADWRADTGLRMCSLAARGLWADLLSYMHEGEPYGYLKLKGKIPSINKIATMVGSSQKSVKDALVELEENGVLSRSDDGIIYSRRMVRDKAKADSDRANGKNGGNPKITKGVNPSDKAQKPEARVQSPESDSKLASTIADSRVADLPATPPERAVYQAYAALHSELWPDNPSPVPGGNRMTNETHIKGWLAMGAAPEFLIEAIATEMRHRAKKGLSPPAVISLFRNSIVDAISTHANAAKQAGEMYHGPAGETTAAGGSRLSPALLAEFDRRAKIHGNLGSHDRADDDSVLAARPGTGVHGSGPPGGDLS